MPNQDQQLLESQVQLQTSQQETKDEASSDLEQEELSSEEFNYANRLAAEQDNYLDSFSSYAQPLLSGPSLFKYAMVFLVFALPNDLLDALDLSGIGMIASWLISAFLSVATVILMWFTDSEFQRVKKHLSQKSTHKQVLAGSIRKIATKLNKFSPKNPMIKVIAGALLEFIPIISLLPWASISVYLAYRDEKRTYKEAMAVSETEDQLSPYSEPALDVV